ncbi:MAG TPA: TolC family protein [Opitutaceae bacterium]|nr:TolC family protein [Opitutaceae bacterium]
MPLLLRSRRGDFGVANRPEFSRAGPLAPSLKSIALGIFARFVPYALILAAAAVPALRAQDGPPPVAVDGTMPEDRAPALRELIRVALKQSPAMLIQQLSVAQSQAQVMQADSSLYPHLSLNAGYSVSREQVSEVGVISSPSTSKGLVYGANLSQNIFSWGQYVDQSRIARIQLAITRRQFAEAYLSLVQQIRDSYLGLIVARENLRGARFSLQQADAALALAREQLAHGDLATSALSQPELGEGDAKVAADTAEESYEHGKRLLAILCGVKEIDDSSIPEEMPAPAYSEEKAKALLAVILREQGRSFFQEQVYEMQIKADKLNYRIAATGLLPKFSLGAGYSLNRFSSLSNTTDAAGNTISSVTQEGVRSTNYGLNMNWNVFDGLSTHASKMSALDNRRMHERTLQDYVDRTAEEAQDLERQLSIAAHSQALADTRATYAQGSADQAKELLKYGGVARTAVDSAISTFYSAQYSQAYSRSLVFSRWCQLVYLAGADPTMSYLPVRYVRGNR